MGEDGVPQQRLEIARLRGSGPPGGIHQYPPAAGLDRQEFRRRREGFDRKLQAAEHLGHGLAEMVAVLEQQRLTALQIALSAKTPFLLTLRRADAACGVVDFLF